MGLLRPARLLHLAFITLIYLACSIADGHARRRFTIFTSTYIFCTLGHFVRLCSHELNESPPSSINLYSIRYIRWTPDARLLKTVRSRRIDRWIWRIRFRSNIHLALCLFVGSSQELIPSATAPLGKQASDTCPKSAWKKKFHGGYGPHLTGGMNNGRSAYTIAYYSLSSKLTKVPSSSFRSRARNSISMLRFSLV